MEESQPEHLTIKELPEDIRPRERLILTGAKYISDIELLAIVLSTGTKGRTALDVSQILIRNFGNFGAIGNANIEELVIAAGIGPAKAARILASIEIGRRLSINSLEKKLIIESCKSVADLLMPTMRYLEKEYFKALILDTKHKLIKIEDIAIGTLNGALVHPRELYRAAIKLGGAALIVAHNHPSGDPSPSDDDIILTKRLTEAGKILGINFLDHIIIGDGKYSSLKKLNKI